MILFSWKRSVAGSGPMRLSAHPEWLQLIEVKVRRMVAIAELLHTVDVS